MKAPLMKTEHACPMPTPSGKQHNTIYVCECGCGWRTVIDRHYKNGIVWKWEQVL